MDTTPASTPSGIRPHLLTWLGAWLLLTVYFLAPAREAYDQSLDKSNYATYTHFASHQAQWGQDVIPMTGPLGFILYGQTYTGELFWVRLFADLVLKGVFSACLLHIFVRAGTGPHRWIWLALVVFIIPTVDDLFHDFAILVATLVLLANLEPKLNRWNWLATVLLGALALFKGTQLVTTGLCFGAVMVLGAWERRWRTVGTLVLLYIGSVVGFWMLSAQSPGNLPAYVQGVLELSSGYNAVMGLDESRFFQLSGIALAAGLAVVFAWAAAATKGQTRAAVALLLLVGFSFIKWKHGYLRADGHTYIFFASVAVITPSLCLATFTPLLGTTPENLSPWYRRIGVLVVTAVTGWAVLGACEFWLGRVQLAGQDVPLRLWHNARYLANPSATKASLEAELELNRRAALVPQIATEIGNSPVDFFGFEQGLLLLNGFNYHPRPMGGGSFNVFTPWLQEKNEAFIRDPDRAPSWQVLKLQTLDDHLPAADDALTLRAIIDRYSPVLLQRDYLLLKLRKNSSAVSNSPLPLVTRRITSGEIVSPPSAGPGKILLFSLKAPLSASGKLRSFLYRPPELSARIVTRQYPKGRIFALKPIMLQHPVILSPLLSDNLDIIRLWGNEPGDEVQSIQLIAAPGFEAEALSISFYAAARPQPPENCDISEIITYRKNPLYNRQPIELVSQDTGIRDLYKEPITIVHAPGSITWELAPGDQQLIFSYGLMPQAYLDGGRTDGVEFNVEVLWPPNDGRIVFKRMVRPVTTVADRGMQRARVFLPPFEKGARLRIRTDPGPDKDGAFDQSYVTRVQIKSGPVIAEQFNGLGVVPADGILPHGAVAAVGARPVFLIHAPGEVTLNVPAGATGLSCDIGLLPGAYQNGGNTDGVAFSIEALRPDGTRQRLLDRYLDPVHVPGDRGPQTVKVPLDGLPNGVQLRIATGVGPHGDRSWDHSYVAGVTFH
jgi:hypothetical protein